MFTIQESQPQVIMAMTAPDAPQPNNIIMNCADSEMLKITPDGFYVRGKKVEQDDKEAVLVYNAFKEFLTYHALTRNY
jgi:hypothetical protein